ncbi:MAG: helicase-like protein [Osedax symbiont Rs1]|nr:MAG: helicase-like protein [Osedax symbiont Rs1]
MNSKLSSAKYNSSLTTGGSDHFLPKLIAAINSAKKIDMTVAFVRETGMKLLIPALREALERGAAIRILTCDYLQITDPAALRTLLLLKASVNGQQGAQVKIFESKHKSFHMKAYIFIQDDQDKSSAFIGSSNITKSALTTGLEWNLRVEQGENPHRFNEICYQITALFEHKQSVELTHAWVDDYQKYYQEPSLRTAAVIPGADEQEVPATPNEIQIEALAKLEQSREAGHRRGLVVLATGMGKTWLSAFDSKQINAKRILFVAHREEILFQAEATFVRIHPTAKVGRYTGKRKELNVDMMFASIQTLGLQHHLDRFGVDYFDYIVVDEFHHASARTYQQLLSHFTPRYLLGLTATPERTDQSDILSLCDDNLVYHSDLLEGINRGILAPFHYYGIGDESVNYQEISWRNNKFDHNELVNQLATLARASHAFKHWKQLRQSRTLAFCISQKHADFMAAHFVKQGIKAVSVHSESAVRRNDALTQLEAGAIEVVFSVDLFNEGVDLPAIDTVLMLRPTESKIIFMQQLGRGLRRCEGKDKLIIVDFIGNHQSFFNKPEALFNIGKTNSAKKDFIKAANDGALALPEGCFINYDPVAIDFMQQLTATRIDSQVALYESLKASLGYRPSLSAFYHAGGKVETLRREHGSWFQFVTIQGDLATNALACINAHQDFLQEVEVTQLTKSFKLILLESLLENDGFKTSVATLVIAQNSFDIFKRRSRLVADLPKKYKSVKALETKQLKAWHTYWLNNPINAWIGGNKKSAKAYFSIEDGKLKYSASISADQLDDFNVLLQELVNYRFSQYEQRLSNKVSDIELSIANQLPAAANSIPYFSDLKIACGHFKTSTHDSDEIQQISLPEKYGILDPAKHFIARAIGDSMDGGRRPICDGDYLLLEQITSNSAGSISNQIVVIERQDTSGDDQYLLRSVNKIGQGQYELVAQNSDFETMLATEDMLTLARLKDVIDPMDLHLHRSFMRAEIPGLFGLEFNRGSWEAGHVCPKNHADQFLLVTLNKQGKIADHQYHDYFEDAETFHWQSQNMTAPLGSRGQRLINHQTNGSKLQLFVRKNKLEAKKGAPFYYCGTVNYVSHEGEKPMSVLTTLDYALSDYLKLEFVGG